MRNRETELQLSLLFNPDEGVCAAFDAMGTQVFARDRVDDWAAFFSINPLNLRKRRRDENVTALRNFLVEFDETPLEEQRLFFEQNREIFSTVVFSGGKSYHGIIALSEALPDRQAYKSLFRRIQKATKCDVSNSNPSRFSRLAGHFRDEKNTVQELVAIGKRISLAALEEWLVSKGAPIEAPLPPKRRPTLEMKGGKFPLCARTWHFLHQGAESGGSHRQCLLAAYDMLECKYTKDEAIAQLKAAPWPSQEEGEIERIVEHVYRGEE